MIDGEGEVVVVELMNRRSKTLGNMIHAHGDYLLRDGRSRIVEILVNQNSFASVIQMMKVFGLARKWIPNIYKMDT